LKITYINKSPSTIDSTEKTAFIKVFKTLLKQFKQTFEHLIHLHENKKMNFIIILMKEWDYIFLFSQYSHYSLYINEYSFSLKSIEVSNII
jgi:hypothetical protein